MLFLRIKLQEAFFWFSQPARYPWRTDRPRPCSARPSYQHSSFSSGRPSSLNQSSRLKYLRNAKAIFILML